MHWRVTRPVLEHHERDLEVAGEADEAAAFGKALLDQLRRS